MWRRPRNGDSPVFLAMTHMRWSQRQSGREGTGCTLSVVPYVGGLQAWPIDKCSNKDAGGSERKTHRPKTKENKIRSGYSGQQSTDN